MIIKRGLEKYRQDGAIEFAKASCRFIYNRTFPKRNRFVYNTYKNYFVNKMRYEAVPKPYETIDVNPDEIKYHSFNIPITGLSQIRGGEWDQMNHLSYIDEHTYVKGIHERYIQGKPWEDTSYVAYAEKKISENGERWGCSNVDEFINSRCAYVDEIYEDIKNNGYNSEIQSGSNNKKYTGRSRYKQELDPLVLISRDGEIIWRDGYHRYAIANILDLSSIPVNVLCRHQDWQLRRDEVSTKETVNSVSHPDLQDVI